MTQHHAAAVRRVAEILLRRSDPGCETHLTWHDFARDAREVMDAGLPTAGSPPQQIRPGTSNPENLYLVTGDEDYKQDIPIGSMRTRGLAEWVCAVMNAAAKGDE